MQDDRRDAEQLAAFLAADSVGARVFVATHRGPLRRFARRLLFGDEAAADDAVQETFLAVLRKGDQYQGRASVRSWLFAITRNACLMRRRPRAGEPAEHEPLEALGRAAGWGADPGPGPEILVDRRQRCAAVERALRALSPEDREVLLLRDVEELSGAETAEALSLSVAAMKSRLHRARLRLAARMREEEAQDDDRRA